MTLVDAVAAVLFSGVVLYAVFGGADFGTGVWDLTAGTDARAGRIRRQIDHSIGPVWEANHVWLIFVLVVLWTGFPVAFGAMMRTLAIPWLAVGVGIVLRGAGFAFRKYATSFRWARVYGVAFSTSSIITPFFLGTIAGAIASGRVPAQGAGDRWTSWTGPTSMLGGVLAVLVTAFLAAVLLTHDAARVGKRDVAEALRRRALATAVVAGVVALGGIVVLAADAPTLIAGLTGRGLPLVVASALGGVSTIALLLRRRYPLARVAAAISVAAVVVGWGVAQYPWLHVDTVRLADAAGARPTLWALLLGFGLAVVIVGPALVGLLVLVDRGVLTDAVSDRPRHTDETIDTMPRDN